MTTIGVGRSLTPRRRAQLDHCRHMVATRHDQVVGFAAFELTDAQDLLVHELSADHHDRSIISALVTALELACLAAGGTRLLFSSVTATPNDILAAHGYVKAPWAGWLEKCVP